jgi:hypothetical protein
MHQSDVEIKLQRVSQSLWKHSEWNANGCHYRLKRLLRQLKVALPIAHEIVNNSICLCGINSFQDVAALCKSSDKQ